MSDIQADRGIIAGLFDALLLVADGRGAPDRLWEGHADLAHERNIVRPVVQSCAPGRVVPSVGRHKIVGMAIEDAVQRPQHDFMIAAEQRDLALELSRSEEHTSELQSLMRSSYAVFCLKK